MYYRAYFLDEDGHIRGFCELVCVNDEEAKQKAVQLLDGYDVDLWQEGRQVFTLKHADKS